jgi:hypothetical protein
VAGARRLQGDFDFFSLKKKRFIFFLGGVFGF